LSGAGKDGVKAGDVATGRLDQSPQNPNSIGTPIKFDTDTEREDEGGGRGSGRRCLCAAVTIQTKAESAAVTKARNNPTLHQYHDRR